MGKNIEEYLQELKSRLLGVMSQEKVRETLSEVRTHLEESSSDDECIGSTPELREAEAVRRFGRTKDVVFAIAMRSKTKPYWSVAWMVTCASSLWFTASIFLGHKGINESIVAVLTAAFYLLIVWATRRTNRIPVVALLVGIAPVYLAATVWNAQTLGVNKTVEMVKCNDETNRRYSTILSMIDSDIRWIEEGIKVSKQSGMATLNEVAVYKAHTMRLESDHILSFDGIDHVRVKPEVATEWWKHHAATLLSDKKQYKQAYIDSHQFYLDSRAAPLKYGFLFHATDYAQDALLLFGTSMLASIVTYIAQRITLLCRIRPRVSNY